jgi:hypothetical protein
VTAADLLERLHELGIEVRVHAGQLRLRGRGVVLSPDLCRELRAHQASIVAGLDEGRQRRRLDELGASRAWPAVELVRGVTLLAGQPAWSAFLRTAGVRDVQVALAALGAGPAPPPAEIAIRRSRLVAGAIPCPECGSAPFTYAAQGPPWRRCAGPNGCGHEWNPEPVGEENLDA